MDHADLVAESFSIGSFVGEGCGDKQGACDSKCVIETVDSQCSTEQQDAAQGLFETDKGSSVPVPSVESLSGSSSAVLSHLCPKGDLAKISSDLQEPGSVDGHLTSKTCDNSDQLTQKAEVTLDTTGFGNCTASVDTFGYAPPTFDSPPSVVIYREDFVTFTKGVKWASDGVHFAVCTDDNRVHIRQVTAVTGNVCWWTDYDEAQESATSQAIADCEDDTILSEVSDEILTLGDQPDETKTQSQSGKQQAQVKHVVSIREAQPVHDFAWHPSHEWRALVITVNTQPMHLFCGETGKLLCSYTARNHLDEHVSAYSVQFTRSGERLLGGFRKFVRVFDVERPGVWQEISTWKQYQAGIVAAVDSSADGRLLAVGTYCGTVALYDFRSGLMVSGGGEPVLSHAGGVTQVRISFDDRLLYSGARRDNAIVCRDLRNFSTALRQFPRRCTTNQRLSFDLPYEENYLCTGNTDGTAFIWDLSADCAHLQPIPAVQSAKAAVVSCPMLRPSVTFCPHANAQLTECSATNGVSFHPWAPVVVTCSGGRADTVWDEELGRIISGPVYENCVKIWRFDQCSTLPEAQ